MNGRAFEFTVCLYPYVCPLVRVRNLCVRVNKFVNTATQGARPPPPFPPPLSPPYLHAFSLSIFLSSPPSTIESSLLSLPLFRSLPIPPATTLPTPFNLLFSLLSTHYSFFHPYLLTSPTPSSHSTLPLLIFPHLSYPHLQLPLPSPPPPSITSTQLPSCFSFPFYPLLSMPFSLIPIP